MEGRSLALAAVLAAAALVATALVATAGVEGTWSDSFLDTSQVQSYSGVRFVSGTVSLTPKTISREGLSFALSQSVGCPSVVKSASTYFLYYCTGSSVGAATSSDGVAWTDRGTVIPAGFQGTNDSGYAFYEGTLLVGSTIYMWYSGRNSGTGLTAILLATSTDGLNWTGAGTVLGPEPVSGTYQSAYAPSVLWNGTAFLMWYTTYDGSHTWIRWATSTDGSTWTRKGIALAPQAPDATFGPRFPSVVKSGADYVMWYHCSAAVEQVCRARSPAGGAWTPEGPALSPDPNVPGETWIATMPDAMQIAPHQYRVWYAAAGTTGAIYSGTTTDGYASPGYLTSVPIYLPTNETWLWLSVDKVETATASVRVSVLDAGSSSPIPGYVATTGTNVSLTGIDWKSHAVIRLNGSLASTAFDTPMLLAWSVAYGTPPPPPPTPASPLDVLVNPLFVVLIVLVAAGAVFYVVLRRKGRSAPPAQ